MIDSAKLLSALQGQFQRLMADLRGRVDAEPAIGDPLRAEYQEAFDAERTGWTFTEWVDDRLTQVAVGWLLACVFVRFGEDNGLIPDARIAGPGQRGVEARAAQQDHFNLHPHESDRDYLHDVFRSAAALPGLRGVLGEHANPLWLTDPSADACTEIIALLRRTDDDGTLALDFTDPARDTRFLGDLYQDLSEQAKKNYALLQTPVFVEEFILDRTLEPAIEAFGLAGTSLIDPTCGSGHFLLGAFDRLFQRWYDAEPTSDPRLLAQQTLDAIWGVDLNPFAAAIARFRLLVVALGRCRITSLTDAPDFAIHIAVGDSLLWGARETSLPGLADAGGGHSQFLYATEDAAALQRTFDRQYAAVVGNPPYIVPKDKAANAAYREKYGSCSGKYSLGVPFTELFFRLAKAPTPGAAGFVGMITANSFMKREFGKVLVEQYIPGWDLTHVIDTSGAYIPGHGTPTVILFGRNQPPVAGTIRSVLGIRGEPSTPADPTKGLVWSAIVGQIDEPGSQSDYVSVVDTDRTRLAKHPWSIGGGGAAELKEVLDHGRVTLGSAVAVIGVTGIAGQDEAFVVETKADLDRAGVETETHRPLVIGDRVRDWSLAQLPEAIFPYADHGLLQVGSLPKFLRRDWPYRTTLGNRATFAKLTYFEEGRPWWEWHQVALDRLRTPLSIAFAFVATHNHFVLDRGGKVFKQSAPVIKLPEDSTLDDHLGLLALLNSSVACFWLKQVCFAKSGNTGESGEWGERYEFDGTKVEQFPLPPGDRPVGRGAVLDALAAALSDQRPSSVAAAGVPGRAALESARSEAERLFTEMVSAQEELDWHCLHLYGLIDEPLTAPDGKDAPPLRLGERAFEIVLARQVAAGDVETAWFTRHGSTPITEVPAHWPAWYRELVERRIALIETDRDVGLVERPENKRRWARTPWEEQVSAALREWLLERLEDRTLWFEGGRAVTRTVAQLADRVTRNTDWMEVARLWAGAMEVDPVKVVADLVADEHVPAQAGARYKESGLAKRAEWERVWALQRAEDAGREVGRIPVPPKYGQGDFSKTSYWTQRGKLDVPKERFVSVIGAERDASAGDPTLVLAWAGFDDAERAQALATLLLQRRQDDGWAGERLVPLIAALDEVVPWVEQWHPEVDPGLGQTLGAFYRGQVDQALDAIGATRDAGRLAAAGSPTRPPGEGLTDVDPHERVANPMLLRDAITIPESVRQGDLVFKLSDAAEHARETVAQYVVTPQLEASFLDAVGLVKDAVTGGTSKAAYLSGSFGAGKSNFMGILQLLLDGNPDALAKPALAPVVAKLSGWSEGKRFLTVPYHLIGATSLESAVLGGYVEHIREVHPDAPLPAVFADEPILALVDEFRSRLGDEQFFAGLGTSGGSSGWGDLDAPWDAPRYDAARALPTSAPERRQLVQAALDTYAAAMADIARANRDGYVDIDAGLEAISAHAAGLGYAGLILFLDELILWLMGRMADPEFVSAESAKISKLVEGSDDRRPAPIISVIARQRDLRELVGTDVPGLDRMGFIDNLKFQAGRFSDIRLDDSNLPAVAHERLLKPKDAAGAQALEDAFRGLSLTDEQRNALRGENGTDEAFRLTYPFSPAFLTVVVDVAGALQRTRTGLRVLLDLLVRNRDALEVGQLVPVGDLYDVLAASEEPLSDEMRATFESARDLYDHQLRPMLLAEHGLSPGDEPSAAFRTDDRLVKTLLLAALVPFSEPFKNLTARKLLALNHGLINSPVPGAEVGVAITKINTWATRPVGLQTGGDSLNPTVRVVLSGLDAAGILDAVAGVDNTGARRKLIKDLVCEGLEVPADQLIQSTKVTWRGLERNVDLLFGNIRNADELPDSQFAPNGDNWKVVIDFPFDDEGVDPNADFARVEALRDHGPSRNTVCWIPSHLTAEVRSQVGDLVRLNHLIPVPGQISDRLREATQNLSAELREVARSQLEAMRRATRDRLRLVLKQAYGVATPDPGVIDTSLGLADHFPTLVGGLAIAPPVAPDLRAAFEGVLGQAMAHVFPAAPEIDGSISRADLAAVLRVCTEAVEQPGLRIPQVEAAVRKVMARIANPLRLGMQAEQSFTLEGAAGHWDSHFAREIGKWREAGGAGNPTVADLRRWIDQPRPMGLSTEVQNLVILVWALATDRTFLEHGGPARVELARLDDGLEVAAVDLPGDADWAEACERAEYVLGVASLPATASAVGLARLSNALAVAVSDYAGDADAALTSLEHLDALLPTTGDPARLRTARSAAQLIRSLGRAATDLDRVRAFREAVLEPSAPAIGASLKASAAVVAAIGTTDLAILKAAAQQPGASVGDDLTALMETDELALKFAARLNEIYQRARDLVIGGPPPPSPPSPPPPPSPPTPPPPSPPPAGGEVVLDATVDRAGAIRRLAEVRQRLEDEEGEGEYTIHVTFRPALETGT